MIEHESDRWPERRWAIERFPVRIYLPSDPAAQAAPFKSARERDAWVALDPVSREAVGKRHPAVKRLRQQWRQDVLKKLADWKERHA